MGGIIVAVLVASQGFCAEFKPESPDPKLWLSDKQYDFGTIPPTAEVTHDLTIQNRGGKPLVIKRVATTCGCATGIPGKKTLAPGESTKLTLHFDPRDKAGRVDRTLSLFCNDPTNEQQLIYVGGTVDPDAGKAGAVVAPPPPPAAVTPPASTKAADVQPPTAPAAQSPAAQSPAAQSPAAADPSEITLPDE
jgi:hypothetical protein